MELKRIVSAGAARHGMAIMAGHQTAGRGQQGSIWAGNANENLYLSLFIDLNLPAEDQFRLNVIVSLAVAEVLEQFGLAPNIKWPNDIYCNKKKIGGILIENQVQGSIINNSIIGMGINLNQEDFGKLHSASSLYLLSGRKIDPASFAATLLEQLQWRLSLLNEKDAGLAEYYKRMLFYKEIARFEANAREFHARVLGISNWGKLILEEKGKKTSYDLKEIKWLDL